MGYTSVNVSEFSSLQSHACGMLNTAYLLHDCMTSLFSLVATQHFWHWLQYCTVRSSPWSPCRSIIRGSNHCAGHGLYFGQCFRIFFFAIPCLWHAEYSLLTSWLHDSLFSLVTTQHFWHWLQYCTVRSSPWSPCRSIIRGSNHCAGHGLYFSQCFRIFFFAIPCLWHAEYSLLHDCMTSLFSLVATQHSDTDYRSIRGSVLATKLLLRKVSSYYIFKAKALTAEPFAHTCVCWRVLPYFRIMAIFEQPRDHNRKKKLKLQQHIVLDNKMSINSKRTTISIMWRKCIALLLKLWHHKHQYLQTFFSRISAGIANHKKDLAHFCQVSISNCAIDRPENGKSFQCKNKHVRQAILYLRNCIRFFMMWQSQTK